MFRRLVFLEFGTRVLNVVRLCLLGFNPSRTGKEEEIGGGGRVNLITACYATFENGSCPGSEHWVHIS
jgi:hypothetical protein